MRALYISLIAIYLLLSPGHIQAASVSASGELQRSQGKAKRPSRKTFSMAPEKANFSRATRPTFLRRHAAGKLRNTKRVQVDGVGAVHDRSAELQADIRQKFFMLTDKYCGGMDFERLGNSSQYLLRLHGDGDCATYLCDYDNGSYKLLSEGTIACSYADDASLLLVDKGFGQAIQLWDVKQAKRVWELSPAELASQVFGEASSARPLNLRQAMVLPKDNVIVFVAEGSSGQSLVAVTNLLAKGLWVASTDRVLSMGDGTLTLAGLGNEPWTLELRNVELGTFKENWARQSEVTAEDIDWLNVGGAISIGDLALNDGKIFVSVSGVGGGKRKEGRITVAEFRKKYTNPNSSAVLVFNPNGDPHMKIRVEQVSPSDGQGMLDSSSVLFHAKKKALWVRGGQGWQEYRVE